MPDWTPVADLPLDEQLPVPWPETYVEQYDHPFNPWSYQTNAALLCSHARTFPGEASAAEEIATALFQRMLDYSSLTDSGARFVEYRFDRSYEGVPVTSPWVSGLGNGAAISGTMALHVCFGGERYLDTAYELAEAYRVLGPDDADHWFSNITEDNYLWFEEQPLDVDQEQPMILNGHVTALTGLYYLWDLGGRDDGVLELLRAGLAAAAHYSPEYRRPGQTNCYDLSPPCHDDYGPERTVRQQQVMYDMTEDPRFLELRDLFAGDMGIDPEMFVQDR